MLKYWTNIWLNCVYVNVPGRFATLRLPRAWSCIRCSAPYSDATCARMLTLKYYVAGAFPAFLQFSRASQLLVTLHSIANGHMRGPFWPSSEVSGAATVTETSPQRAISTEICICFAPPSFSPSLRLRVKLRGDWRIFIAVFWLRAHLAMHSVN